MRSTEEKTRKDESGRTDVDFAAGVVLGRGGTRSGFLAARSAATSPRGRTRGRTRTRARARTRRARTRRTRANDSCSGRTRS